MKCTAYIPANEFRCLLAGLMLLCTLTLSAKGTAEFDFSDLTEKGGKITDASGKGVILPGRQLTFGNAPAGMKSLVFNGTTDTAAKLDLTAGKADFSGFEFSMAYWIKYRYFSYVDRQKTANVAGSGNDNGFGFSIAFDSSFTFSLGQQGPGKFMIRSAGAPGFNTWHHVAFVFSAPKKEAVLYFDGEEYSKVRMDIPFPLVLPYGQVTPIGCFRGELAGLRIWDHAVSPEMLTSIKVSEATFESALKKINAIQTEKATLKKFAAQVKSDIEQAIRKGSMPIQEYYAIERRIQQAQQLGIAAANLKTTQLKDAPFAVMQIQACSPVIRVPDLFPEDGICTDTLELAAAKGEYEPVSFAMISEEAGKIEFEPGDFKSADGGVIPAAELDMKLVKCWYQADWETDHNPKNQKLVPDLLLNDFDMVRVDEVKRKNFLRFQYPDGDKWEDVNFSGTFETVKKFNYLISPTWDAPKLLPVPLQPGRTQQFWFTLHVPKEAKPGVYTSAVKMKWNGQDAGTLNIKARVYPFELPVARTNHDLNQLYYTYTVGESNLYFYAQMTGELEEAERILRMDVENMVRHNVLNQACAAPGNSPWYIIERDVKLRKEAGALLKPFWSGLINAGSLMSDWQKSGDRSAYVTPERVQRDRDSVFKNLDNRMARLKKLIGHDEIFFEGFDENSNSMSLTYQSTFRKDLMAMGYRIATTGWDANYEVAAPFEDLHYRAGRYDLDSMRPEKWHAIGGQLLTYAAPFAGPDNPDLMRRSHGLEFYKMNYDGYLMLSYVSGLYIWNERVNGAYRNFLVAYPTSKGPVNTISFEGIREGLDDVRYATLLRTLIVKAEKSEARDIRMAARRASLYLEDLDPHDFNVNLDKVRKNLAGHILNLQSMLDAK